MERKQGNSKGSFPTLLLAPDRLTVSSASRLLRGWIILAQRIQDAGSKSLWNLTADAKYTFGEFFRKKSQRCISSDSQESFWTRLNLKRRETCEGSRVEKMALSNGWLAVRWWSFGAKLFMAFDFLLNPVTDQALAAYRMRWLSVNSIWPCCTPLVRNPIQGGLRAARHRAVRQGAVIQR